MTRKPVLKPVAFALCTALVLAGCGLRGELKTPPPMWGDDERTDSEKTAPKTPAAPKTDG